MKHVVIEVSEGVYTSKQIKQMLANLQYYNANWPIERFHLIVGRQEQRVNEQVTEFADLNGIPISYYHLMETPLIESLIDNSNAFVLFYTGDRTKSKYVEYAASKDIPTTVWTLI